MHPLNGNPYQIIDGKRVFLEVAEPVAIEPEPEPVAIEPEPEPVAAPVFPFPKG